MRRKQSALRSFPYRAFCPAAFDTVSLADIATYMRPETSLETL